MKRATLLLADDHPAVLDHLIDMLSPDFDIVGAVGDGQAAYEMATLLRPDAVVFDISMPVLTGLEAAARLATSAQPPCVVFLTVHQDRDFIEAAFNAGALGYVLKSRLASDLIPAIHEALAGRTFLSAPLIFETPIRTPAS
jgi:DNA-binding NarL/FixJ family response regulator